MHNPYMSMKKNILDFDDYLYHKKLLAYFSWGLFNAGMMLWLVSIIVGLVTLSAHGLSVAYIICIAGSIMFTIGTIVWMFSWSSKPFKK